MALLEASRHSSLSSSTGGEAEGGGDLVDEAEKAARIARSLRGRLRHNQQLRRQVDALTVVLESDLFNRCASVLTALQQVQQLQRHSRLDPDDFGLDVESGNLWLSERGNEILEDSHLSPAIRSDPVDELPPTALEEAELQRWLQAAAAGKRLLEARLRRGEGRPLGFSVVGMVRESGELGLFVQGIVPGSPADVDGQLEEKDQLLAIDNVPLDGRLRPQAAVSLLQSVQQEVRLHLCRDQLHRAVPRPIASAAADSEEAPDAADGVGLHSSGSFDLEEKMLNTEWTEVEVLELANDGSGLGFGIIGSKSTGVVVRTILPGGVADTDGRLRSGDHLVHIGDVDVRGMTSEQVAKVLRQSGGLVRLVVARALHDPADSLVGADGRRCHLLRTDQLDRHLQLLGGLRLDGVGSHEESSTDQIVLLDGAGNELRIASSASDAVRGTDSESETENEAADDTEDESEEETEEQQQQQQQQQQVEEEEEEEENFRVQLLKDSSGLGIIIAGYVGETQRAKLNGIFIKSIADGSAAARDGRLRVNDRIVEVNGVSLDGYSNHDAVDILKRAGSEVNLRLIRYKPGSVYEQLLASIAASPQTQIRQQQQHRLDKLSEVTQPPPYPAAGAAAAAAEESAAAVSSRWRQRLGIDNDDTSCEIIVADLSKSDDSRGLGFNIEGTVDLLDSGQEVQPHHYIRSVLPDGPAAADGRLRGCDELLEVNGQQVFGLNHLEVVEILKRMPQQVRVVCARRQQHQQQQQQQQSEMPSSQASAAASAASAAASAASAAASGSQKSRSVDDFGSAGVWSNTPTVVELQKCERGLGFSVLDYQDPLAADETVIIVKSLVPGGTAHLDGRLLPGDRLLFVNDTRLTGASLEEAVQCLKAAPMGAVRLGVAKPCPLAPADLPARDAQLSDSDTDDDAGDGDSDNDDDVVLSSSSDASARA